MSRWELPGLSRLIPPSQPAGSVETPARQGTGRSWMGAAYITTLACPSSVRLPFTSAFTYTSPLHLITLITAPLALFIFMYLFFFPALLQQGVNSSGRNARGTQNSNRQQLPSLFRLRWVISFSFLFFVLKENKFRLYPFNDWSKTMVSFLISVLTECAGRSSPLWWLRSHWIHFPAFRGNFVVRVFRCAFDYTPTTTIISVLEHNVSIAETSQHNARRAALSRNYSRHIKLSQCICRVVSPFLVWHKVQSHTAASVRPCARQPQRRC